MKLYKENFKKVATLHHSSFVKVTPANVGLPAADSALS